MPMYLIGSSHPNKKASQRLLENAVLSEQQLVTDVEVFQEILHRYTAINRREAIQPAFDALYGLANEIYPIELKDIEQAKSILDKVTGLSARDALHVAVMRGNNVDQIVSFDTGFDQIENLVRLS